MWAVNVCFTDKPEVHKSARLYGDGIRESTISLRFLKLEISTFVFVFLRMNKLVPGFLLGFPPFGAFIIIFSMEKRCIYIKIKSNKRKECYFQR